KVPSPGESITEVQLASWLVDDGEIIEQDAEIAEVDSDKATLTINAPEKGLIKILVNAGDTVNVGTIIATIDTSAAPTAIKPATAASNAVGEDASATAAKGQAGPTELEKKKTVTEDSTSAPLSSRTHITPLARKVMEERNLTNEEVVQQLGGKRVGKADIE